MFYRFDLPDRIVIVQADSAGEANRAMNEEHARPGTPFQRVTERDGRRDAEYPDDRMVSIYYANGMQHFVSPPR